MTITYTGTKPGTITDGSGRKITLSYYGDGKLQSITDPAARVTQYSYSGDALTSITYPDNKVTQYTYTASGNMTSAINHDGYKMGLEYYTVKPYRIKSINESHTDGTLGQKISMEYGNNSTTFTDIEGRKNILQFNNIGNTLSIRDDNGKCRNHLRI